jgi:hypothetical protein
MIAKKTLPALDDDDRQSAVLVKEALRLPAEGSDRALSTEFRTFRSLASGRADVA